MFRKCDALSCVYNVITPGLPGGHSLVITACGLNCYIKKIFLYSFLKLGNIMIAEFLRLSFNEFQLLFTHSVQVLGKTCPAPMRFQTCGMLSRNVCKYAIAAQRSL